MNLKTHVRKDVKSRITPHFILLHIRHIEHHFKYRLWLLITYVMNNWFVRWAGFDTIHEA
jgi:hypothetical protein